MNVTVSLLALMCFLTVSKCLPISSKETLATKEETATEDLQPPADISNLVEVDEKDIPEGAWVIAVEETLPEASSGEIMQTANNIAFRPLFRYRQRQGLRQGNRRIRRRYYMPRRSYRDYPQAYYYGYSRNRYPFAVLA